ncbi:MAG TPA: hypothetical protein VFT85_07010 [Acidimicrobiia bacterium]|nr:hypothetical protein [Acidimicrobiia bacterium]
MSTLFLLRTDLAKALRDRDRVEISTLRTLIAAVENATAVDVEPTAELKVGLGHDQPRRVLSDADMTRIIRSERDELVDAATRYRELGLMEEMEDLQRKARIAERYLPGDVASTR